MRQRLNEARATALMERIEEGFERFNLEAELLISGNDQFYEPPNEPMPTAARPGTAQKIEVIRQRLEAGEGLWHDLDGLVS